VVTTRACRTAAGGAGSAWMPVAAGCRLTGHGEASDPSDDPSPAAAPAAAVPPVRSSVCRDAASRRLLESRSGFWLRGGMGSNIRACACSRVRSMGRGFGLLSSFGSSAMIEPVASPVTGRGARTRAGARPPVDRR
jgi:hypothetical protein